MSCATPLAPGASLSPRLSFSVPPLLASPLRRCSPSWRGRHWSSQPGLLRPINRKAAAVAAHLARSAEPLTGSPVRAKLRHPPRAGPRRWPSAATRLWKRRAVRRTLGGALWPITGCSVARPYCGTVSKAACNRTPVIRRPPPQTPLQGRRGLRRRRVRRTMPPQGGLLRKPCVCYANAGGRHPCRPCGGIVPPRVFCSAKKGCRTDRRLRRTKRRLRRRHVLRSCFIQGRTYNMEWWDRAVHTTGSVPWPPAWGVHPPPSASSCVVTGPCTGRARSHLKVRGTYRTDRLSRRS